MKAKVFKVKLKKSILTPSTQTNIPGEEMLINVFPDFKFSKEDLVYADEVKEEERERRSKERAAIALKARYEYFKMFTDDDLICFEDDCDGNFIGTSEPETIMLYLWGVENKRHWWEYGDLPKGVLRGKQNYPSEELSSLEHIINER